MLHCETKDDNGKECSTALHLLATTVHGVESWLWPCLINALLDPACVSSVSDTVNNICHILMPNSNCFFSYTGYIIVTFIDSISDKSNTQ